MRDAASMRRFIPLAFAVAAVASSCGSPSAKFDAERLRTYAYSVAPTGAGAQILIDYVTKTCQENDTVFGFSVALQLNERAKRPNDRTLEAMAAGCHKRTMKELERLQRSANPFMS